MFKKIIWISLPVFLFLAFIYILAQGLNRSPNQMPTALLDKPLPDFQLTDLFAAQVIHNKSVLLGEVAIINVFASWCPPCAAEHPLIMKLADQGFQFYGLNYQDERFDAIDWLGARGNPYQNVFYDKAGSVGIDWGVIAVPETFLIDAQGIVRYRYIGELTEQVWEDEFLPRIKPLQTEAIDAQ